ncbi:MAG: Uma2 family endonuclease [Anaerolineae bacterium]|nr:Uma2 family endonuclease [Anaerolineae bacterium]
MATETRLYQAADLQALPDGTVRYELVNGALVPMNPPSFFHSLLTAELLLRLGSFVRERKLGMVLGDNTGYLLYTDPSTKRQTVRLPDVSFVRSARKPADGFALFEGASDLAVETVSPSDTLHLLNGKLRDHFTYGTVQVWLEYPMARAVKVYTALDAVQVLKGEAVLSSGALLPDFQLPLSDLFACLD